MKYNASFTITVYRSTDGHLIILTVYRGP